MKTILFFLLITAFSLPAFAVKCDSADFSLTIAFSTTKDILVTLRGETVTADGIVTKDEVDLVARFPRQGELTLYARMGKTDPANYVFLNGKRNPVICR
jgi:hypothetical protein